MFQLNTVHTRMINRNTIKIYTTPLQASDSPTDKKKKKNSPQTVFSQKTLLTGTVSDTIIIMTLP